jgi:hypothetical protein
LILKYYNKEVIAKLALPGKIDDFLAGSNFSIFLPKMHSPGDETYTKSIGELPGVESGQKRAILTGEWSFAITSKVNNLNSGVIYGSYTNSPSRATISQLSNWGNLTNRSCESERIHRFVSSRAVR